MPDSRVVRFRVPHRVGLGGGDLRQRGLDGASHFDGAGYAVLARAWMSGQGYRAIDHPDGPRHTHFPPGYPSLLAMTWEVTGISVISAPRRLGPLRGGGVPGGVALVSPHDARTGRDAPGAGGGDQLALGADRCRDPVRAALPAARPVGDPRRRADQPGSSTRIRDAVVLGILLAACLLTRHAAIGLALAVLLDLSIRRRWRECVIAASMTALLVSPWIVWMATAAGPGGRTQADLLVQGNGTLPGRIGGQLIFYIRRIPDQITGPFVEVGTVFRHSTLAAIAANDWAIVATTLIAGGWVRTLCRPRRRLAGMVAISTLLVLLPWPFTEAGRFLIPMIPCILIGAVEGLAGIANGIGRLHGWNRCTRSTLRMAPAELVTPDRGGTVAVGLTALFRIHAGHWQIEGHGGGAWRLRRGVPLDRRERVATRPGAHPPPGRSLLADRPPGPRDPLGRASR